MEIRKKERYAGEKRLGRWHSILCYIAIIPITGAIVEVIYEENNYNWLIRNFVVDITGASFTLLFGSVLNFMTHS